MKIKEDVSSSLKEIVTYKAVPDKFIVKFFDKLDTELADNDFPFIEKLLCEKSYDIQLSIINYIKRCCNARIASVLIKLLNISEIKFFIKMEALLTLAKLDKDKKAQAIINRMIDKLSTKNAELEKQININLSTEKIVAIFKETLIELLTSDCRFSNAEINIKQIKQFIAKEKLSVASNIQNDFDGSIILNLNEYTAIELINHLYANKFICVEQVELDEYGIFNNLYIFFERLNKKLKYRFGCEDVQIEFLNTNSFSYAELILSEKEDNTFLFDVSCGALKFNIGIIIYIDDNVRIREFNEVIKNLNVYFDKSENAHNIFKFECKATKFSIEYAGIQKKFEKVMGNRILLDAEKFAIIKTYYNNMLNEIKQDSGITSRIAALISFLVKICDNTTVNARNYLLFKLNQINPFFSKSIFNRMTFENEILKYDDKTARMIINKMTDDELALIIFNCDRAIRKLIFTNISHNRVQSIKNIIAQINPEILHKAKIKKALDKFIEYIKEHKESETVYINRISDEINDIE